MTVALSGDLHRGPDTHTNRPAATAVGVGTLYECTTHNLIYRSDGTAWSTYAAVLPPGGTAGQALVKNTSTDYDASWGTVSGGGGSGGFGAYSSYTPALTAVTTNPTLGTGAVQQGRYAQDNKTVTGHAYIKFGTSGVAAGSGSYRISLPVAADMGMTVRVLGSGDIYDASASTLNLVALALVSSTTVQLLCPGATAVIANSVPWTWAANDELGIAFTYQAA